MAIAFVGAGAGASGATSCIPALPAGVSVGDVMLCVVEGANQAPAVNNQGTNGAWAILGAMSGTGTAGGTSATSVTLYWDRFKSGQTDPIMGDGGGDHIGARIYAWSGVKASGNPWNAFQGSVDAVSDTSLNATGVTTTVNGCEIVCAATLPAPANTFGPSDATAAFTATSPATLNARPDAATAVFSHTSGNDGKQILVSALQATAGATGTINNTLPASAFKAMFVVALEPAPAGTDLVVQEATQGHTVDSVVLTQVHALTVAEATQGQTVDNVALTQVHQLAVQEATQAHTADNVAVSAATSLVVQEATQGQTVDGVALTQVHQLAVVDATQAQTADGVALTQVHVLAVAEARQTHTADGVALTQVHQLVVAEATQAHTADNVTLGGAGQLTVQEATQAQTVDHLALTQVHMLTVADAAQAHTADGATLTQAHQLAVAEATQLQAADTVSVTQLHQLVVADARQAHTADTVTGIVSGDGTEPQVPRPGRVTALDATFDMAERLLDCVGAKLADTTEGAPPRLYVAAGAQIAWDDCECGQLTVHMARSYPSDVFPLLKQSGPFRRCEASMTVTEYVITILRCAPGSDQHGRPPPAAAMTQAARVDHEDRRAVRAGVACCFEDDDPALAQFRLVQDQLAVGEEGQCVGSELHVFMGFPNCAPCVEVVA